MTAVLCESVNAVQYDVKDGDKLERLGLSPRLYGRI
jgi:hypothetical protein